MSILELNGTEFRNLAHQLIENGHRVRFRATGESMRPFILNNDILEVAPFASRPISWGDIVLVETSEGHLLAHRVVKTSHHNGISFLIKGDACESPDGWFQVENILGRVESVERGNQQIRLTSLTEKWRARAWITLSSWAVRFSWLPGWCKEFLRDRLWVH